MGSMDSSSYGGIASQISEYGGAGKGGGYGGMASQSNGSGGASIARLDVHTRWRAVGRHDQALRALRDVP